MQLDTTLGRGCKGTGEHLEQRSPHGSIGCVANVFRLDGKTIRHFWGCELLYVPPEPGQQYRHNHLLDPVWNMFDLLPEGRGHFEPKLSYA